MSTKAQKKAKKRRLWQSRTQSPDNATLQPSTLTRPKSWETPIERPNTATLRFTAYSWAKFNYLRDLNDAEVFCFAITDPTDPLLIKDLWVPKQKVTSASVDLDSEDLAIRYEQMGETAPLSSFTRIWLHTHPGNSASPSGTDVDTQTKIFGTTEWSVMAILAKGGDFYSELMWWGPGGSNQVRVKIPWQIDWHEPFEGADPDRWSAEYIENVSEARSNSKVLWKPNQVMGGPLTQEEKDELDYLTTKFNSGEMDNFEEYLDLTDLTERTTHDEPPVDPSTDADPLGWI